MHVGEEFRLRGLSTRLTLAGHWGRAPQQLTGEGADGFPSRLLHEGFGSAHAADPHLTPQRWLAGLDPATMLGRVRDALVGSVSATLLYGRDPGEYVRALRQAYGDFRTSPPPYDAGVSYGSHRYLDGDHLDLGDSDLLVRPMNAARLDRKSGLWLYPAWDEARDRATRSVTAVQASRVWGREIPLDLKGRDLFEALEIEHSLETFPCYLDPELRQSRLQTAFHLSTGYAPTYRSVIVAPGGRAPGLKYSEERNAQQARWELAARFGPELLDPKTDLAKAADKFRGDRRPAAAIPEDSFSQLSPDELFGIAQRKPKARVWMSTFEWEHHRSQRFTAGLVALVGKLGLGPAWASRFSMLTGLCEPENVHLVSPAAHAALDIYAKYTKLFDRGQFKPQAFAVNTTRKDRFDNSLARDRDDRRDQLRASYPTLDPKQIDQAMEKWVARRRLGHPDLERAKNPLVAYEPRHVIALLSELQHPDVERAARGLRGADRARWDDLIDQLTKASVAYGIAPAFPLAIRR